MGNLSMQGKQVYAIADNIINSLGFSTTEVIQQIEAEQTGIYQHEIEAIYPTPFWASLVNNEQLQTQINKEFVGQSVEHYFTRLEQMFLLSIQDVLRQTNIDVKSKRVLIIIATTKGNIDLLEQANRDTWYYEKFAERLDMSYMGDVLQKYFGNPNQPLVVCNACISGVLAINIAQQLLQTEQYDHIIVTGGDLVSEFTLSGFFAFKAVCDGICKPYDQDRTGINLGEGVATVLLTTDAKLAQKYSKIRIGGGGSSNDANHISGPSRTGDGLNIAIQKAFKQAACSAQQIDYVSMHGTGTSYNDEMESKALGLANLLDKPMNSLKAYFGHTLGAAGLMETIVAMASMRKGLLFKSLGYTKHGVSQPIQVIQNTQKHKIDYCLKTASGFGGCNAALVLAKIES
ncbi:MAG: hypothetical protein MK212_13815 [Saprospiraceae bacterium]|nr:hypothetical protein [Saprospiraceae bacterium]